MLIRKSAFLLIIILILSLFVGCAAPAQDTPPPDFTDASVENISTSDVTNTTDAEPSEAYVDSVTMYSSGNELV